MISGQRTARATERRYNFAANQLHFTAKRLETVQRKKSWGLGCSPLQLQSKPAIISVMAELFNV